MKGLEQGNERSEWGGGSPRCLSTLRWRAKTKDEHYGFFYSLFTYLGVQLHYTIYLSNIPAEVYEYVVNGRSAVEWVMERYQVKTDKDSGIVNDPIGLLSIMIQAIS